MTAATPAAVCTAGRRGHPPRPPGRPVLAVGDGQSCAASAARYAAISTSAAMMTGRLNGTAYAGRDAGMAA